MTEQLPAAPKLYTPEFFADPYPTYAELRERGPVHRVVAADGLPVWLVTRVGDARAALTDPRLAKDPRHAVEILTSGGAVTFDEDVVSLARHLLNTDPPDHTRLRRLVGKAFTPRRVEDLRPRVQRVTDELIDRIAPRGRAELIGEFASPLPTTVICELLGIPDEDRVDFSTWSTRVVMPPADEHERQQVVSALRSQGRYLAELLAGKRRKPGDDLLSALIAARDDNSRLDENELVSMVFLLIFAGHETTVNLIGNGLAALLRESAQLARLRAEPALLPAAIEEFLRFEGPVDTATYRFTTEEVKLGGVVIPAGQVVRVGLASANHDPSWYEEPDRLDITRERRAHLAFGHGIHHCLGAPLARMTGAIAIGTVLRRLPGLALAVPPGTLRWRPDTLFRGLHELPVTFGQACHSTGQNRGSV